MILPMTNLQRSKQLDDVLIPQLILIALLLLGCSSTLKQTPLSSSAIYAPQYLTLPPLVPVQTSKGVYTPPVAETFVRAEEYQRLQNQVLDLTSALNQGRATSQVQP
jgi:hypothetical protein